MVVRLWVEPCLCAMFRAVPEIDFFAQGGACAGVCGDGVGMSSAAGGAPDAIARTEVAGAWLAREESTTRVSPCRAARWAVASVAAGGLASARLAVRRVCSFDREE